MFCSLKRDLTQLKQQRVYTDDRVDALEDNNAAVSSEVLQLKVGMAELTECNRTIIGRLMRAETRIDRLQKENIDLKARLMRDNIIVRSKGDTYKSNRDENTASVFRKFISQEMRVPNANEINVTRAHRMGQASGGFNKMMIAKVPSDVSVIHDVV